MRKVIAVVEDDSDIRDIIGIILEEENYEVKLYSTALNFMSDIDSISPDLMIFDIMLPDGNGLDLCHEMKNDSRTSWIPVLMMSAHAVIKDVNERCSPQGFIPKPFNIDDFVDKVSEVIN